MLQQLAINNEQLTTEDVELLTVIFIDEKIIHEFTEKIKSQVGTLPKPTKKATIRA